MWVATQKFKIYRVLTPNSQINFDCVHKINYYGTNMTHNFLKKIVYKNLNFFYDESEEGTGN